MDSVKVLATLLKRNWFVRKILHVSNVKDLIAQSRAQQVGCLLDSLLQCNTDFMDYIDVDSDVDTKNFDRSHAFLSARLNEYTEN